MSLPPAELIVSWRLDALKDALKHLAAPATEQIRYISALGCHFDELALDLEAVAVLGPDMLDDKELTITQFEQLQRIDQKLLEMSGPGQAELWTELGLTHAPEWAEIRMLTQDCLKKFGID